LFGATSAFLGIKPRMAMASTTMAAPSADIAFAAPRQASLANVARPNCQVLSTVSGSASANTAAGPWVAASTTVGVACAAAVSRRAGGRRRGAADRRTRARATLSAAAAEVEVVQPFVSVSSSCKKWEDAIDELADSVGQGGFEAGFAFISEYHMAKNGIADILEALREKLGVRNLIGCACGGGIGQPVGEDAAESAGMPVEIENSFVISVGLLREGDTVPFFKGNGNDGDLEVLSQKAADGDVRSMIVLSDPFAQLDDILKGMDEQFPKAVKAGGISSVLQVGGDEKLSYTASIAIATEGQQARLCNQGIVGLMMTDVEIQTVVCQGCRAVGPPVRVSEMVGPECRGIGGRPAQQALQLIFSSVTEEDRAKMQQGLTIGVGPVGASEGSMGDGDWLVRGITGVTPEGGLVVGGGVEEGQPMRFHVRDRASAESDLEMMLKRYRLERQFYKGVAAEQPMGCLLFTCNGRGEALYDRKHVDARAGAEALGSGMDAEGPLMRGNVAGFFANGEIGAPGLGVRSGDDEPLRKTAVHGFTAVYALLIPVPKE